MSLLKNTASQVVTFCLVNATDGSALTGATVTTKVTKDGTQAASAGTLTELGSGQYKYVPTQGETNAASVGILFTATNAVPVNLHMFTDDYAARDAAVADAVWDEAVDDHLSTLAFGGQWRDFYSDGLYENFRNVVVPNIAGAAWDEALAGHATAGSAGKKLSDISTGTPLGAADIRAAIGLASANLDTQLDSIPTAAENAAANPALSAAGVRAAVGLASANLDTQLGAIDDLIDTEVAAIKTVVDGIDTKMGMPNITLADDIGAPVVSLGADVQAVKVVVDTIAGYLDTEIAAIKAKTDNLPASPSSLDAAAVRAAVGLASNNLDTQLSNTYNRIGAPAFGDIAGDIAANYAILTNIEDSVGVGVSVDVAAIKAKTDNLPADPASSTNVTAVYSRVGAPAGASVSADIAAINTNTTAAAQRAAVGLAAANLDTQLTAIDDLLDTEIAAIKAKTDNLPASPAAVGSAMTLADGAITDAKIAEVAFMGKHFDTDIEIAAVTGAVGSVTAGVTVTTNSDKTGYTLTSGERNSVADALLDRADAIATGLTLRQGIAVTLAAVAAKLSGAATATITVRDINDTKNVLVITVDANGNRTAVTVTP